MTVCIAAITLEKYIVTLSDTMIGSATSSADMVMVKMGSFAADWLAMMAADDVTQCIPIIEKAGVYFQNRANTLQVARSCLKRAYQNHLAEKAADNVLGRYQMDMAEFKKSGKRRFTESEFNRIAGEINTVKVGCEFLAAGFDSKKHPHLFTVEEPGTDCVYSGIGFCAIGSGKYAAESMLLHLGQAVISDLYQTLFNVYAAKFMAEKVSGVGKHSHLFVKKPGSTTCGVNSGIEARIREEWENRCAPRSSQKYIQAMRSEQPVRFY